MLQLNLHIFSATKGAVLRKQGICLWKSEEF